MSATVLPFPVAPRLVEETSRPKLAAGDIVLTCVNDTLGLWCAWPVAVVDDDGVPIGVTNPAGKLIGADRLNCRPDVYGFAAEDHWAEPFAALRWKTWQDVGNALSAFAAIGVRAQ